MNFLISDTFTDSLGKLTGDEQKATKTTSFDLQLDPANPGMQFHRIEAAKDSHFWSVRVSRDIRLIVHRTKSSLMLCYVDHHDEAYRWAERRKIERHPKTGAMQLVEIREKIVEIPVYQHQEVAEAPTTSLPFLSIARDELLGYGVPEEWIGEIRGANEDTIFDILDHLPGEAAEAMLELATGGRPKISFVLPESEDAFAHPDSKRRFRVMTNQEALQRALDFPWDKWSVFLHPDQESLVTRDYNGPARISGSAGTGKTVVALHRAVHLVRTQADSRVLLTTFSAPLAKTLQRLLRSLITHEPKLAERLDVRSMDALGHQLYKARIGPFTLATDAEVKSLLDEVAGRTEDLTFSARFVWTEWAQVIDAWQVRSWEEYRDLKRSGRRSRLGESQRQVLWRVYEQVRSKLQEATMLTQADVYSGLAEHFAESAQLPYDYMIVDEAQDISVAQLRFLSAMCRNRPDSLFLAGDLGQRIFQPPFSWLQLGVDVRGRSHTLRINYRTSHQIRRQADRLLDPVLSDLDGNKEERGTISVFNGPPPDIRGFESEAEEVCGVAAWITQQLKAGVKANELAVFVRSEDQLARAQQAVEAAGQTCSALDGSQSAGEGTISISTMHLAKGLEFRAVVVMACDDEVLPLQSRMANAADATELEDAFDTERHLLYVACTRARDRLLVTCVEPASEFLDDLIG